MPPTLAIFDVNNYVECDYCQGLMERGEIVWYYGLPFHRQCLEARNSAGVANEDTKINKD